MKSPTVKVDPLMEIISKKLSGLASVSPYEQGKMVQRACKAASDYHNEAVDELTKTLRDMIRHAEAIDGDSSFPMLPLDNACDVLEKYERAKDA